MPKPEITLVNKKLIAVLDTLEYEQRKPSEDRDYTRAQELFEQCLTESKLTSIERKVLPYLRGFFAANNSEFHTAAEWIAKHCLDWDVPQMRLQKSAGQFHYYIEGRRINEELPVPYLTLPAFTNAQAASMLLHADEEHATAIAKKKGLCLGLGGVSRFPEETVEDIKRRRPDLARILWPESLEDVLHSVADKDLRLAQHVPQESLSGHEIQLLRERKLAAHAGNVKDILCEAKYHPLLGDQLVGECFQRILALENKGLVLISELRWSVGSFLKVLINLAPLEALDSFKKHMLESWNSFISVTSLLGRSANKIESKFSSYSITVKPDLIPLQEMKALKELPDDCMEKLSAFLYELYSTIRNSLVSTAIEEKQFKIQVMFMLLIGNLFMRIATILRERKCLLPHDQVFDLLGDGFSMTQDLSELSVSTPKTQNRVKLPFERCAAGQPVATEQELVSEYARALLTAPAQERGQIHELINKADIKNKALLGYINRLKILMPAHVDTKQKGKEKKLSPNTSKIDRYHHLMLAFACHEIELAPRDKEQKPLISGQSATDCIQQLQSEFDVFSQCFLRDESASKGKKAVEHELNETQRLGEAMHAMASLLLNCQQLSEAERGQLQTIRENLLRHGFEYQRSPMHEAGVSTGGNASASFGSVRGEEGDNTGFAMEMTSMKPSSFSDFRKN